MSKKYDTTLFSSNARASGADVRNVEFKNVFEDSEDGGPVRTVINKTTGHESYNVRMDTDKNKYYVPEVFSGISEFEAKVRVINNDIDNYSSAANAKTVRHNYRRMGMQDAAHVTDGMIYQDKKVASAKRQETIENMDIKPDGYVFVANAASGNKIGFLGNNGEFVENWGAPVDTSMVKYYADLDECVADTLMFNYKNSNGGGVFGNGDPFIAIPKNSLPK